MVRGIHHRIRLVRKLGGTTMVDVILADANMKPVCCSAGAALDWAAGSSENYFELSIP